MEPLGLLQVGSRATGDDVSAHDFLHVCAGGLVGGDEANGDVAVGHRAHHPTFAVADGEKADVLVPHPPRGLLHPLLGGDTLDLPFRFMMDSHCMVASVVGIDRQAPTGRRAPGRADEPTPTPFLVGAHLPAGNSRFKHHERRVSR